MLRVEFLQSRARAKRWEEEVLLLREEMRRVLQFLLWSSHQWVSRVTGAQSITREPALLDGLRIYAHKQSAITLRLESHFRFLWKDPLHDTEDVTRDQDDRLAQELLDADEEMEPLGDEEEEGGGAEADDDDSEGEGRE